jgi:hypothetical protein
MSSSAKALTNEENADTGTAESHHETLPDMGKKAQSLDLSEAIAQQKPNPWTANMFMVR